jgi:acyl-CoA synthetase (NDP forming)
LDPVLLRSIIRTVLASSQYDALVVVVGSSSLAMPDLVADAIRDCLDYSDKPIITYVSPHAPNVVRVLETRGVPAFLNPESCAVAFNAMLNMRETVVAPTLASTLPAMNLLEQQQGALNEYDAARLFEHYGIRCADSCIVHNEKEAVAAVQQMQGPAVLKVLSSKILHKSEVGGVRLSLTTATMPEAFRKMVVDVKSGAGIDPETFIIQPMLSAPAELIIGMNRDPLGTALMVGMGGITAELMNDSVLYLMAPQEVISEIQARQLLKQLKAWPLFDGYRGKPKLDVDAAIQAIIGFSTMIAAGGERLDRKSVV